MQTFKHYEDISDIPYAKGCGAVQGFATGSTYAYTIKVAHGTETIPKDTRAMVYRTHLRTRKTSLMQNARGGHSDYTTELGHGNDIVLAHDSSGRLFMYVATMRSNNALDIVKLEYKGNSYQVVGGYSLHGTGISAVSGITKTGYKSSGTVIQAVLKSSDRFYEVDIPLDRQTGILKVSAEHQCNFADLVVAGEPVRHFIHQGITYHKGQVFCPLWGGSEAAGKPHVSVVAVFDLDPQKGISSLRASESLSFRIRSKKYSTKFEIEGVGVDDNPDAGARRLWFNTNRISAPDDNGETPHRDGVHAFRDYQPG
ncbi:MAG: hypothetical protein VX899_24470 [Myxococcota bacterium]|nr:hypothetical protein [Myxococcota bacterium]